MSPVAQPPIRVLRVGLLTPVRTLDPLQHPDAVSQSAMAQVFETLYALPARESLEVRPRLADGPLILESQGPAGQVYSARIAKGTVFSDGTPLDAAQVAASLSRVEALTQQSRIDSEADRVVFSLKSPNPRFALTLVQPHAAVALDKSGELLGTGAFVPAPGSSLERLRLLRNPLFRRPVALDEVAFEVYPPDESGRPVALIRALEAGEVDFTSMLSRNDVANIQGVRKLVRPSNATAILYLNTARAALSSRLTRKAIILAVDRKGVTEISYSNVLAFCATGLLPPSMGSAPDKYVYDPAKASSLLAEAGVTTPLHLDLLVVWAPRPYLPNPLPVATLVARQLLEIGIKVTVHQPKDHEEYLRLRERGEYDLVLAGWIADTPDPADFLDTTLRSDRIPGPNRKGLPRSNLSRRADPAIDDALRRFREDPSSENLAQVLGRVADEALLLPLMYGPNLAVSSFRVQNVEVSPLGIPDFSVFRLD